MNDKVKEGYLLEKDSSGHWIFTRSCKQIRRYTVTLKNQDEVANHLLENGYQYLGDCHVFSIFVLMNQQHLEDIARISCHQIDKKYQIDILIKMSIPCVFLILLIIRLFELDTYHLSDQLWLLTIFLQLMIVILGINNDLIPYLRYRFHKSKDYNWQSVMRRAMIYHVLLGISCIGFLCFICYQNICIMSICFMVLICIGIVGIIFLLKDIWLWKKCLYAIVIFLSCIIFIAYTRGYHISVSTPLYQEYIQKNVFNRQSMLLSYSCFDLTDNYQLIYVESHCSLFNDLLKYSLTQEYYDQLIENDEFVMIHEDDYFLVMSSKFYHQVSKKEMEKISNVSFDDELT